jgi:hypothetical protein
MLLPRRYVPAAQASRLPDAVGVALMLRLPVEVTVPVAVPVLVLVPEVVRLAEGVMEAVDVALCRVRVTQGWRGGRGWKQQPHQSGGETPDRRRCVLRNRGRERGPCAALRARLGLAEAADSGGLATAAVPSARQPPALQPVLTRTGQGCRREHSIAAPREAARQCRRAAASGRITGRSAVAGPALTTDSDAETEADTLALTLELAVADSEPLSVAVCDGGVGG